jgi:hypothetical protein
MFFFANNFTFDANTNSARDSNRIKLSIYFLNKIDHMPRDLYEITNVPTLFDIFSCLVLCRFKLRKMINNKFHRHRNRLSSRIYTAPGIVSKCTGWKMDVNVKVKSINCFTVHYRRRYGRSALSMSKRHVTSFSFCSCIENKNFNFIYYLVVGTVDGRGMWNTQPQRLRLFQSNY